MPTTAVIVAIPEAELLVGELRRRFDPTSLEGVPAHVTVLVPFIEALALTEADLSILRQVFGSQNSFQYKFADLGQFPEVTYLRPADPAPFIQLTEAVHTAFPKYPPYQGAFADVIPHLTVGHGSQQAATACASALCTWASCGPAITGLCSEVRLIEQQAGAWSVRAVFKLANSDA